MAELPNAKDVVVTIPDGYIQTFTAYGLRFGLRANDASALAAACAAVPFGWQAAPPGEADVVYTLHVAQPCEEVPGEHRLSCDTALAACTPVTR